MTNIQKTIRCFLSKGDCDQVDIMKRLEIFQQDDWNLRTSDRIFRWMKAVKDMDKMKDLQEALGLNFEENVAP